MKAISTTNLRKNISDIIDSVKHDKQVIGIGRREKIEAYIIPAPESYNSKLSEIANFASNSLSYDFLENEPELYSVDDLKEFYDK